MSGIWTGDSYIPDCGTFGDLAGESRGPSGGNGPNPSWVTTLVLLFAAVVLTLYVVYRPVESQFQAVDSFARQHDLKYFAWRDAYAVEKNHWCVSFWHSSFWHPAAFHEAVVGHVAEWASCSDNGLDVALSSAKQQFEHEPNRRPEHDPEEITESR